MQKGKGMTRTNIDKKGIAKSLYLDGNYTQEEIADKVGTTRQTVNRWVKAENWDTLKASVAITPAQIISQWSRQIIEINNAIAARDDGQRYATPPEADALGRSRNLRLTSACPIVSPWPCVSFHGYARLT